MSPPVASISTKAPEQQQFVKPHTEKFAITLKGYANSVEFFKAKTYLEAIEKCNPSRIKSLQIIPMGEMDFLEHRQLMKKHSNKIIDKLYPSIIIQVESKSKKSFYNFDSLVKEFVIPNGFDNIDVDIIDMVDEKAELEGLKYLVSIKNPLVYMDIKINDTSIGRIIIELFKDTCPKSVDHFLKFINVTDEAEPSYLGTKFTRFIAGGWVQGGEIRTLNGELVKEPILEDENFVNRHTHKGTLSFVNSGPHSNCTSFMITLAENLTAFDKKYVSFGRIIQGNDVLNKIEAVAVRFERPVEHIIIEDVGVCALK